MSAFDPTDLTFNGEEIRAISEAAWESTFDKPEMEKLHTVVTGIVAKKQIVILGRLNGYIGLGDGGCDPTDETNTFDATEKFWDPEMISFRLPQCWTDIVPSFFLYALKPGVDKADLTSTDFLEFLLMRIEDAVLEAVYRHAWFGDKAAALVSGGGVITNGTNLGYFNRIDSFFVQLLAIVTANAARKSSGLVSKNGQATTALQKFDTTDRTNIVVTNTLDQMTTDADLRLQTRDDKMFISTKSVYDQYVRELKFAGTAYSTERIEQGIKLVTVDGIELYYFALWDDIIRVSQTNGTKLNLPHRIVLGVRENIQVGVEEVGTLTNFKVWNENKDRKTYIEGAFNLDAKIIHSYLVQVAW